jgi:hypothetical protein
VPFQPAAPVIRHEVEPASAVYWGFGGKRRPGCLGAFTGEREPSSGDDRKASPKK